MARVTGRKEWIDSELAVRWAATTAAGTRIRKGRIRTALAQEWAQMTLVEKAQCVSLLRAANQAMGIAEPLSAPAEAARIEAEDIRKLPDSDQQSQEYWKKCRVAIGLYQQWQAGVIAVRDAWNALSNHYMLLAPLANRSAGQQDSIDGATRKWQEAITLINNRISNTLATMNGWLRTDPIYANPGRNANQVLEDHVPRERLETLDTGNFSGDGIAGMWRSVFQLTAGNDRLANVWVTVDPTTNTITDRLVSKEVYEAIAWDSRIIKDNMPIELECHRLAMDAEMNDGEPLGSFLRLRTSNRATLQSWWDPVRHIFKVYTAWCPHGVLTQLMQAYVEANVAIPEPMIWNVAESLVRSGQRMANLAATNNGAQMVHRDLKPSNVFLDVPTNNHYPDYPSPRLGDFGEAVMTSQADPNNPIAFTGFGTPGYTAPEMMRYMDATTVRVINAAPLLEHTNVWQAGAILRFLVLLQEPEQSLFLDEDEDDTYWLNDMEIEAANSYSAELLRLIDSMMQYDHALRPTFSGLAATIASWNASDEVTGGIRNGTAPAAGRAVLSLIAHANSADRYAVGLAPPP